MKRFNHIALLDPETRVGKTLCAVAESIQRTENERLRKMRMLSVSEEEAVRREREAFVRGCRHATAYRHEDASESEETSWKEVAAFDYPLVGILPHGDPRPKSTRSANL